MSKDTPATLAAAMRRATTSQNATEDWLASAMFAALHDPKLPVVAQQGENGRFVMLHSGGPIDLVRLARAAAKAVQDAQASQQRQRERPESGGYRLPDWDDE